MRRSMSCGAYTLSMSVKQVRRRCGSIIAMERGASRARGAGESTRRAFQQEIREQRRRPSGAPLGCTALVRGTGDVQVRPLQALRELAEEGRRGDRPAIALADVGEVGEVALELLGIFLRE